MSAPTAHTPAQPSASSTLLSVFAIIGTFLLFALILYWAYIPSRRAAATVDLNQIDESIRWKYTDAGRKDKLAEVRAKAASQDSYGWVDQQAGVVRLPIARAKELLVQEHARSAK